jgi:DNA-directed RNA polymerase subunit RPC12/RpoP
MAILLLRRVMKIVKKRRSRRCPKCGSNKWDFIEAVQVPLETLLQYLLVKYRCLKCGEVFLSEEGRGTRYVKSAERCFSCDSKKINKISKEGADMELYQCGQCGAFMGKTENKDLIGGSFFIVDSRLIKKR